MQADLRSRTTGLSQMVASATVGAVLFLSLPVAADDSHFEAKVAPLFIQRCIECHNDREAAGELNLTSLAGLQAGGQSGPVVEAGNIDASYLWERVAAGEMPPALKGKPQPLAADELQSIKTWIEAGADWPARRQLDLYEKTSDVRGGRDWWSFQRIVRPEVPSLKSSNNKTSNGSNNPIDAFIGHRLATTEMHPAPPAEKRVLIRRLYNDLVGLPPTFAEVEQFVHSTDPAAYEKRVDQLLDSPHFGERWGRYWLDLVRYAETSGYERDQVKTGAWKYRDWVIDAINDDLPYDQFVVQQLAGDEIENRNEQSVIATGFLRLGTWNDEPNEPQAYKYERLEDMVHATSSAFLGLTVKCARCHDHKFDPIPQRDYYGMAAAFWAGFIDPRDSKLLGGPSTEELGYDVLGWTDRSATPPDLLLLKNGDPKYPQDAVAPANLSLVPFLDSTIKPPVDDAKTTRRRLQLAQWITDPANPLTARIVVNRMWQHHFGKALVRSPNNFGFTGEQPTHPQLLDWLASELLTDNWKLKRLHKLMVMSKTYRQSSLHPDQLAYNTRDAANRSWWRAERRRIDAETLRDSILKTSGQLDLTLGGPSIKPSISSEALEGLSKKDQAWTPSPKDKQNRRSVYIFAQRSLLVPMMTTFDVCDTTLPCGQRDVTTVPTQALALLNNEFVHQQSIAFAERVLADAGTDLNQQVTEVWRLALGREPTRDEIRLGLAHIRQQRENLDRRAVQRKAELAEQQTELAQSDVATDINAGLALHLRADTGVAFDAQGRVSLWEDQSPGHQHAIQANLMGQPTFVASSINGQPAIRFSGKDQFLKLTGQILNSQQVSLFAVVTDRGQQGNRAIFSNWNGAAGNSVTSLFLGTTGSAGVRLSDNFVLGDVLQTPERPFVLSAIAEAGSASLFQNDRLLGKKSSSLSERNLTGEYVIGQQGNINGEYWQGDIAEIIAYNRAVTDDERKQILNTLMKRYEIPSTEPADVEPEPNVLALASLCHVLLNTNEFIYVD